MIQQHVQKLFDTPEQKRTYLGASAIGDTCRRKVQYQWLKIQGKIETEVFHPRIKMIFDRGHVYETKVREWMEQSGFVFEEDVSKLQFKDFGDKFAGHVDGVILSGPELYENVGLRKNLVEYPLLWENKCINDKSFGDLVSKKLKESKYGYYVQVQVYLHYLKLSTGQPEASAIGSKCLFTAINANTMEIYTEVVEYNYDFAWEIIELVATVFEQTAANKFLERTDNKWSCKYCDFKSYCLK